MEGVVGQCLVGQDHAELRLVGQRHHRHEIAGQIAHLDLALLEEVIPDRSGEEGIGQRHHHGIHVIDRTIVGGAVLIEIGAAVVQLGRVAEGQAEAVGEVINVRRVAQRKGSVQECEHQVGAIGGLVMLGHAGEGHRQQGRTGISGHGRQI